METTRFGLSAASAGFRTKRASPATMQKLMIQFAEALFILCSASEIPGQSDIDRTSWRNIARAGLIVLVKNILDRKLQLRLLVDGIQRHKISGHIVTEFLVVRSVRVAGAAVDQSCSQIELFNRREIDLSRCLETFTIGKIVSSVFIDRPLEIHHAFGTPLVVEAVVERRFKTGNVGSVNVHRQPEMRLLVFSPADALL